MKEDNYKWNINKIFINDEEFVATIDIIKEKSKEVLKYKGKILNSNETLYSFLSLQEELSILIDKVYLYANLSFDTNMTDRIICERKEVIDNLLNDISEVESFVMPELFKSDIKEINKMIENDKRLKKHKFNMEVLFRYKKHTLSAKEEKILSKTNDLFSISGDAFNALDNIDIKLGKIRNEDGKLVELTNSNYNTYIESKNLDIRKNAFNKLYKYFSNHINTFSSLYISEVKTNEFACKVKKYKSVVEANLFGDNINTDLYSKLINVTNNNIYSLKRYLALKFKCLNINDPHMYDIYQNIVEITNKKIGFEEALNTMYDALGIMGDEYVNAIKNIASSGGIDVFPKKAKRSGAYSTAIYGIDPYVLLNFEGNTSSVSTLFHEIGHAMHSYYSHKYNEYIYSSYSIFLAEIASTVNEIIFSEYMYNNSKSTNDKIYYTVEFLEKFRTTVFRQVMFSEFEYLVHNSYEKGESLTKDFLCEKYYELNKKYFSPAVNVDKSISYEWARIPHFYSAFYVYKYATGLITSCVIANKLINKEEGFKEKYIKFLSSGCSDYPLNILKELGIDINDKEIMDNAFKLFDDKISKLETLINKKGV